MKDVYKRGGERVSLLAGVLRSDYLIIGIKLSGIGEVDKVNSVRTDVIGAKHGGQV